jgi:hypothetical protein
MAKVRKINMDDTADKVSISEAVEAAADAVANVVDVVADTVVEEVVEISEATKVEMAAGLAALQKYVTGN